MTVQLISDQSVVVGLLIISKCLISSGDKETECGVFVFFEPGDDILNVFEIIFPLNDHP